MTDHDLLSNLHRRMDAQDAVLTEIRDKVVSHIATQAEMKPALDELIAMWKGSKLILPILATSATILWAVIVWAKDHIRI